MFVDYISEIVSILENNFVKARTGHYKRITLNLPSSDNLTVEQLYDAYSNKVSDLKFVQQLYNVESCKKIIKIIWKPKKEFDNIIQQTISQELNEVSAQIYNDLTTALSTIIKCRTLTTFETTRYSKSTAQSNILLGDNSRFTMNTQLEWEYSQRGTIKWQIKLSYSNIIKNTGKAYKTLSPSRMAIEF